MSQNRPVIILGAMDGEIKAFIENSSITETVSWNGFTFYKGRLENRDVVIAKTGVGKVLSALISQKMIDIFSPSAVLFTGIAGSLNNTLDIGDILIGRDTVQHDIDATRFGFKRGEIPYSGYRFIDSDKTLFNLASTYKSGTCKTLPGRILTGDQFIAEVSSEKYSYLKDELKGDCVEMEGAAVALVAHINQIPHLIIRTISDKADGKTKTGIKKLMKTASENSIRIVSHILKIL